MQKTVELNLLADCPLCVLQRQLDRMNQLQGLFLCHNQQAQLQVNNKEKIQFQQAFNQITATV